MADDVANYGYDFLLMVIHARNRDAAGYLIPRETPYGIDAGI